VRRVGPQNVIDSARLLTGYFDMAGSAGNFDLYEVLLAYILDPTKRSQINAVVKPKAKDAAV